MADLLQFPAERITYPGIDNPVFVSDIKLANQAVLSAAAMITGLGATDFAIISGCVFTAGSPSNTYTSGFIYLNGKFYYISAAFNELLYIKPDVQATLPETFTDFVARNIYEIYFGATSVTTSAGYSPQFSGDMNQYRIGLKYLKSQADASTAVTDNVGTAAFADLGLGAGQVPTSDQIYTQAQVDALIKTRAPSVVGSVLSIYDPSGAIAADFNGAGLGINYPWLNGSERWALMDGQTGRPNMGGVSVVGIGTFTNPDSTTKVFANNATGGETDHLMTVPELVGHTHGITIPSRDFTNEPGTTGPDLTGSDGGGTDTRSFTSASTGGNTKFNLMNPYRAMYMVVRIS